MNNWLWLWSDTYILFLIKKLGIYYDTLYDTNEKSLEILQLLKAVYLSYLLYLMWEKKPRMLCIFIDESNNF